MTILLKVFDWAYRLLYLNVLWMLFSLMGFLIFGLFPSTVAMFYITKEWLNGNNDLPIFKTFFTKFKEEYIRAQIVGLIVAVVGFFLYFNILFFFQKEEAIFYPLRYLFTTLGFVYVMMLSFLFPIFVLNKYKLVELVKNVLIISVTRLHHSFIMVLGSLTILVVFSKFAGFFILFFGSVNALWLTWNAHIAFKKIENKRGRLQTIQNLN